MALVNVITYEGMLFGWKAANGEQGLTLELAYAFKAHAGAIQTLLSSGNLLLCGCADGAIEIFDIKAKVSVGQLLEHKAAVTALASHGSHVLSGDSLGSLVVWRTHDWVPLTKLKGHTKAVNAIAVHPSGRVAISVGEDKQLFLWDLVKGRSAHNQQLAKPATGVRWVQETAADETPAYELLYDDEVALHDGNTGNLLSSTSLRGARIRCSAHVAGAGVLVGLEGGALAMAPLKSKSQTLAAGAYATVSAHERRIRSVVHFGLPGTDSALVATAGGDGLVKLWTADGLMGSLSGKASGAASSSSSGPAASPAAVLEAAKGFRITDMIVVGQTKKSKAPKPARDEAGAAGASAAASSRPAAAAQASAPQPSKKRQREEEQTGAASSGAVGREDKGHSSSQKLAKAKHEGHKEHKHGHKHGEAKGAGPAKAAGGAGFAIKVKKQRVEHQ